MSNDSVGNKESSTYSVDPEVYRLLDAGENIEAHHLLDSAVRLKLLATPPFGKPWSQILVPILPNPHEED